MTELLHNLLYELESQQLEVCKIHSRDGYIRIAVSTNAYWYHQFCNNHLSSRRRYPKLRTFIKRRETINALKRMISGDRATTYAQRILQHIKNNPELKKTTKKKKPTPQTDEPIPF